MRKLTNTLGMHKKLNILYDEFVNLHGYVKSSEHVIPFTNFVLDRYGIKINILVEQMDSGEARYQVQEVFVINEKKYTWFLLETT